MLSYYLSFFILFPYIMTIAFERIVWKMSSQPMFNYFALKSVYIMVDLVVIRLAINHYLLFANSFIES